MKVCHPVRGLCCRGVDVEANRIQRGFWLIPQHSFFEAFNRFPRKAKQRDAIVSSPVKTRRSPVPPRGVAVSGVIFATLFLTSLYILRIAIPADPADPGMWLSDSNLRHWVGFALNLLPFTGIAFLWFMGVLRSHIGELEDRFFATVFLGSGFLFVGMLFVCSATSQGLLEVFGEGNLSTTGSETYAVGRRTVYVLLTTYGLKMAAAFMSVASLIGSRTRVLPGFVTRSGTACAILILVAVSSFAWLSLLFPCWVLLVSSWIIIAEHRSGRELASAP